MMETRFVTCSGCDGSGVYVIGHGRWPDGSENNEERPCMGCDGTGEVEQEVEPVECDDDLDTPGHLPRMPRGATYSRVALPKVRRYGTDTPRRTSARRERPV